MVQQICYIEATEKVSEREKSLGHLLIQTTNIDGGVLVPLRDWPRCHPVGCFSPL